MKVARNGTEYYLDKNLATAFHLFKTRYIAKDWDIITIIDGLERSGKSTLAHQLALFVDPSYTLERTVFNPIEFERAVDKAKIGQAIVFDEAHMGLTRRSSQSVVTKTLINKLTVIGKKNLFIFVLLPSFYELDKYVAVHRSKLLITVRARGAERGYFDLYSGDAKRLRYLKGRKELDPAAGRRSGWGRFVKYFPFDKALYERNKDKGALYYRDSDGEDSIVAVKHKLMVSIAKRLTDKEHGLNRDAQAKILGVSTRTLRRYLSGESAPE